MSHSNPFSNSTQASPHALPPQTMNRASASPSISSLVDPPNQALTSPSIAAQSFFNQQQQQARYRDEGQNSLPPSPHPTRLAPSAVVESITQKAPVPVAAPRRSDTAPSSGPVGATKKPTTSTATSSTAVSPKPAKLKDATNGGLFPAPPPLPGSGLMQLGGSGSGDGTEFRAPTVILTIPMNGEVNKYVNFTRLAEEQYGWDALHPRLAAQRDRLARVAAAGAALERNGSSKDSGDDMSLDSEAEGEGSNIEMGGMSDGRTGTDGGAKKVPRKRKMKEDEYDKDDGFVDDSELLWEEQAAAANDGFFVYSGPLVPEGEKPVTELRYILSFSPQTEQELTVTDPMVNPSVVVEEDVEVEVEEWDRQALEEVPTLALAVKGFQHRGQALEVVTRHASLVSLKPIVHVWSKKNLTGREWVPWQCNQMATEAWANSGQTWATRQWFLTKAKHIHRDPSVRFGVSLRKNWSQRAKRHGKIQFLIITIALYIIRFDSLHGMEFRSIFLDSSTQDQSINGYKTKPPLWETSCAVYDGHIRQSI